MQIRATTRAPSRFVACRRLGSRRVAHARSSLKVQALFGRSAPSAAGATKGSEQVAQLVSVAKRFRAPSEAANEAISELAGGLLKLNQKNAKSPAIYGKWNILYASGQSGLTALPGQIASFKVTNQGYENECATRTLGVFGGYAREGGSLKATGADTFELLQEYVEFKNGPGPTLEEESVDAPVRTFQVLYLDNDVLAMRLKSTRYQDENGRMQSITPDDDYFLVWQKDGAAAPRASSTQSFSQDDDDEEEDDGPAPFSLFGFGTAIVKKQGLATMAERNAGSQGTEIVQDRRAAQLQAAEAKRQAAEERKRAQAEAAAERRQEAEDRKQAAAMARQAQRATSSSEAKPNAGGFMNIFAKREVDSNAASSKQAPAPKRSGGLFGSAKQAAPTDPAAARRAEAEERKLAQARAAEERKQAAAEAAEARRQEAEQRKAEMERAREQQAAAKEQEGAMRARIQEAVEKFTASLSDASGKVKELTNAIRNAQREGKDAMKAGDTARKQLERSEAIFESAEANLEEANSAYNQLVGQMREKAAELQAAEKQADQLEKSML